MTATITIQLSPEAIALANKFKDMPRQFPEAIKRGMDKALAIVSGRIQEKRLTGHGPFPAEQHRLGERTGFLKLQTQNTPATITSQGETSSVVSGAIGSSAKNKGFSYPRLHEFGGKFAPERAPFRTGITENSTYISDTIEKELIKTLETK